MTRTLIAGGADVNARDGNGLTPLMAASAGQVQNIDVLFAAGADINAKDEQGFTALMWAVVQGFPAGGRGLAGKQRSGKHAIKQRAEPGKEINTVAHVFF